MNILKFAIYTKNSSFFVIIVFTVILINTLIMLNIHVSLLCFVDLLEMWIFLRATRRNNFQLTIVFSLFVLRSAYSSNVSSYGCKICWPYLFLFQY